MKKIFTLLVFVLFSLTAKAQSIDSLIVTPLMPDANDTLRIYAFLSFPQGNCADVGNATVVGNTIYGNSFHCMGMGMFICYDVDTVVIPPVMAGTYTLYWSLDAGFGPQGNCSPGFQPYDVDTLVFQVATVLDIPEQPKVTSRIFPNPASDNLLVQISAGIIEQVQIINVLGQEVLNFSPQQTVFETSTESLQNGVYFCRITDAEGRVFEHQVEILR